MKKIMSISFCLLFTALLPAQNAHFDLDNYKSFLSSHKNMSYHDLASMYDGGKYLKRITAFPTNAKYLDSIEIKFKLTDYEKQLLKQNGFAVTERLYKNNTMQGILLDIWRKDLPVFISSDLILNAFHESYDAILKEVELNYLIPQLKILLKNIHNKMSELDVKYTANQNMKNSLRDADLYLTIARKLLDSDTQPFYTDNLADINRIIGYTGGASFVSEPLFSSTPRKVDYSQFKPRGHYTDENYPQLADYFKCMMWLGRIELYLIKPAEGGILPSDEDVQRQIVDCYLLSEAVTLSNSTSIITDMEQIIKAFVGEQDNVTLDQLNSVFQEAHIFKCEDLLNTETVKTFQDVLAVKPFAEQRILSQLLASDPMSPEKIKPASAFLLFGQRFVIDSYITGSVVYDRIENKVTRMLPSSLDILFSLGNSAAAQLLESEIEQYRYATNLAGLRYLLDSYDVEFWENSIYTMWLYSIKKLNPPINRTIFPEFMQTAGWWQHKINSQLSSWAELRHDNLLYAKQSYSGMVICSFPYGYVEPVPEFFEAMGRMASLSAAKFALLSFNSKKPADYMNGFANLMDTLATISAKELGNKEFTEAEIKFLRSVIRDDSFGCGTILNGWYPNRLTYNATEVNSNYGKWIVADYHTAPTDEYGNMVGWVKHAGTASPNLCVLTANIPGVGDVAFAGPVSSYYEYTTNNFYRITDEEWKLTYAAKASRPSWVNSYLADGKGNSLGAGLSLVTDIKKNPAETELSSSYELNISNYPNPFNPSTLISFNVPVDASNKMTEVSIYNVNGELVKNLVAKELPAGYYLIPWNGEDNLHKNVSSGIYFYRISTGNYTKTGKMNLVR